MYDYLFNTASIILLVYTVYEIKYKPLGLTQLFLLQVLLYHSIALIFYRDTWSTDLGLGLLSIINNPENTTNNVFLAMSLCFIFLTFGCLVSDKLYKYNSFVSNIGFIKLNTLMLMVTACVVFIIIILFVQFTFIASPSKIYEYFFMDVSDYDRYIIRRESAISFYPYGVLQFTIIPFLFFCLLIQSLKEKGGKIKKYVHIFFWVIFLSQLAKYTKAGPTLFLIQTLFCISIARRSNLKLTKIDILLFTGAILIVMIVVASVGDAVELVSVIDRLLMIPNEVLFEYFGAIPESYPFGFGRGISYIQAIIGGAAGNYPGLPTHMHVAAVTRGEYGTVVNGFFLADAWAEFGWLGVVIIPFFAGIIIKWYDHVTLMIESEIIKRAMVVFSLSASYTLVTASITSSMITGGILLIPLFAKFINKKFVKKN